MVYALHNHYYCIIYRPERTFCIGKMVINNVEKKKKLTYHKKKLPYPSHFTDHAVTLWSWTFCRLNIFGFISKQMLRSQHFEVFRVRIGFAFLCLLIKRMIVGGSWQKSGPGDFFRLLALFSLSDFTPAFS